MDKTGQACHYAVKSFKLACNMTQASKFFPIGKLVKPDKYLAAPAKAPKARTPVPEFVLSEIVKKTVAFTIVGLPVSIEPSDLSRHWSPHFTADEIGELIVPKRTLARRVANREPLNTDEADRAIRVGHVCVEAERVFGNPEKAFRWLRRPNQTLNDQRPIDLLTSHAGVQVVLERLGQIDHGVFV